MQQQAWPELPYAAWKETCATLQLWTQIVGQIRVAQTPWLCHSWHSALYLTARGLGTSPIPYQQRTFQIDFDFIDHVLLVVADDGARRSVALQARSVAAFHDALFVALDELGMRITIHGSQSVMPADAFFHEGAGEFILPYDAVRTAADPERALRDFLQSTYEAAADAAGWDRDALECETGVPRVPRRVQSSR